jgi:hypothetical protein
MDDEGGTSTEHSADIHPLFTHEESRPKYDGQAAFEVVKFDFKRPSTPTSMHRITGIRRDEASETSRSTSWCFRGRSSMFEDSHPGSN